MSMEKMSKEDTIKIAERYGLRPCKVKGFEVVNIRKHPTEKQYDITWDEFFEALERKGLAVYKASNSDFIKIMKK